MVLSRGSTMLACSWTAASSCASSSKATVRRPANAPTAGGMLCENNLPQSTGRGLGTLCPHPHKCTPCNAALACGCIVLGSCGSGIQCYCLPPGPRGHTTGQTVARMRLLARCTLAGGSPLVKRIADDNKGFQVDARGCMWCSLYLVDVCMECLRADLLALLAFLGVCSSSLSASSAHENPKASLLASQ